MTMPTTCTRLLTLMAAPVGITCAPLASTCTPATVKCVASVVLLTTPSTMPRRPSGSTAAAWPTVLATQRPWLSASVDSTTRTSWPVARPAGGVALSNAKACVPIVNVPAVASTADGAPRMEKRVAPATGSMRVAT